MTETSYAACATQIDPCRNSNHSIRRGMELDRSAFTIVELLVIVSIVGVLVGLTLPAVHAARESTRRIYCQNQLKQLAISIQNFDTTHRQLPGNGGPRPDSLLISTVGTSVRPYTHDLIFQVVRYWGVAEPSRPPKSQTGSWGYSILPFMERDAEFQRCAYDLKIGFFLCPSRARKESEVAKADFYGEYECGGYAMSKTDYAANLYTCPNLPQSMSFAKITDGLSNTAILGEKAFDPSVQIPSSWYWDEPIWVGGSAGTARAGVEIVPDKVNAVFANNWGAGHRGGANFAFADGSVRTLPFGLDPLIINSLILPADAGPVSVPD